MFKKLNATKRNEIATKLFNANEIIYPTNKALMLTKDMSIDSHNQAC